MNIVLMVASSPIKNKIYSDETIMSSKNSQTEKE